MRDIRTETRMYVGLEGFASYRLGEVYQLHVEQLTGGTVAVALDQSEPSAVMQMSREQFEKWFVKA